MKKSILIITVVLYFFCSLAGQENTSQKTRIYESWITSNNKPGSYRGVLYEIQDTSVLITNLMYIRNFESSNNDLIEFVFKDIDVIKTRRLNSVKKGAWIGGAVGLAAGIGTAVMLINSEELGEFGPLISIEIGILYTLFGTGIGALAGSLKNIIPVKGNFIMFDKNRSRLHEYSYVKEYSPATGKSGPSFEHRSYIGLLMGPSFPIGDFANNPEDSISAKSGYIGNLINLGYRITENFGVSISVFNNQYEVKEENSETWWGMVGFTAGPMFSYPIRNRLYLDLKPRIGVHSSEILTGENLNDYATGFAIDLSASMLYNFARKWCVIAETGYFSGGYQSQKRNMNIQNVNLAIGIAYRFR